MLLLAILLAADQFAPVQAQPLTWDWRVETTPTFECGDNCSLAALSKGETIATYEVDEGRWVFEDGYDMDDVGRVLAGLPATKESAETIVVFGSADSTGCLIDDDGGLLCNHGTDQVTLWGTPPFPIIGGDSGMTFSDDSDVGIYLAPMAPWSFNVPYVQLPFFHGDLFSVIVLLLTWSLLIRFWFRAGVRMAEPPPSSSAPAPDGLLDELMTRVFGRSWRTGLSGFAGVALSGVAVFATVEPPITFAKLAPLLPGLTASLGLMVAKDGKVSHTQLPKQ